MKFECAVGFVLLASIAVEAQVIFSKHDGLRSKYQSLIHLDSPLESGLEVFALPEDIDNGKLRQQAFMDATKQLDTSSGLRSGPYIFGASFPVELNSDSMTWETLPDGTRFARLLVHSKQALSLHATFSEFDVPTGAELFVSSFYSSSKKATILHTTGPFTSQNMKENGKFSFLPMRGNTLMFEYFAPVSVPSSAKPRLTFHSLIHGYRHWSIQGQSGSCNIDVKCRAGNLWRSQIRSVAMIMTNDGRGFCSGSMLNNGKEDGRQLFLTANHCLGGDMENSILLFNYESTTCEIERKGVRAIPQQSAHGLKLLSKWALSDFALFEVVEEIPDDFNVHLAGWSAQDSNERYPVHPVSIHFPAADVKKISQSFHNCTDSCWSFCLGKSEQNHWKVPEWNRGTTEPGSSGAPLFDGETQLVVGQLHGGSASCNVRSGYDVFGKLAHSFDRSSTRSERLKEHLDPSNSGIRSIQGMDLNNRRSQLIFQ